MQPSNLPTVTPKKAFGNGGTDKFDHFVLQGRYDIDGEPVKWEDLTAGESLDMILQSENDYKVNAPGTPYRIMSVWKSVSTGQEKRFKVKRCSALYLFV